MEAAVDATPDTTPAYMKATPRDAAATPRDAAATAADIELEPVSPPPLQAQTSRLNVGMIQRITDIMVVHMRYDTEDDGAVEVTDRPSNLGSH